jgi:hypothetical protein
MERYKVLQTLGDGTYGSVHKGINRASGEVVRGGGCVARGGGGRVEGGARARIVCGGARR